MIHYTTAVAASIGTAAVGVISVSVGFLAESDLLIQSGVLTILTAFGPLFPGVSR